MEIMSRATAITFWWSLIFWLILLTLSVITSPQLIYREVSYTDNAYGNA